MGLSVSGSIAIVIIATFMLFAAVYPAASNAAEAIDEARTDMGEIARHQQDTGITIANISFDGTELVVSVMNTGGTTLHVAATSILVDNEYQTDSHVIASTVDGDASTNLWHPGEELNVTTGPSASNPTAVVVVTEFDVAARAEV